MEFSVNHPVLYLLAGILIAVVLAQSVFFLIKALRRSKEIGMDQAKIKKTIKTAALFTIAPAVSIVISVITLSKSLGIPLPWLRLSVVGSLSYEAIAASNAVSAMGLELGKISALTAQQYVNIALVMTLSIMVGIWLVPVIGKKLLRGMTVLENRDAKWADIFQNAMFIGMISAFLGYVFCDFSRLWTPGDYAATSGLVPVCVMAVSAAIMVVCGLLMKKFKWSWVNDYALPISLVLGMASAIPLTAWLGSGGADMKKQLSYIDSVHRSGTIWNISVMILLLAFPLTVAALFGAAPDWGALVVGLIATAPMYWAVGVIETVTFVPMLGAGGSYLSFVTGNISNLKLPCAINALEQNNVSANSEEGEVISTIAIATSSIVTTVIIIIGVILIVPLTPVLEAPVLEPAFAQMLPALFGGLGVAFVSQNWKIAVAPVVLMLVLFIFVPALNAGTVGIMVPVSVLFTIAVSRLLYKRGVL